MSTEPLLSVENLTVEFPVRGDKSSSTLKALNGVSLRLDKGEILGCMGESGCGKSTLAKVIARLESPTSGAVLLNGQNIQALPRNARLEYARQVQLVFQDPYSALPPRMRVASAIEEPLRIHKVGDAAYRKNRVSELLELVGLNGAIGRRFPHQLSGGQRQRINIARALALEPDLLVLDEPVSALDVSIQAQVLNLLRELQQQLSLTYLFISHDLRVVKYLCDNVVVMYLGSIVEQGPSDQVFASPAHPYTDALRRSIPDHTAEYDDSRQVVLRGEVPSPVNIPAGCPFHPRCPMARPICEVEQPAFRQVAPERLAACHFSEELLASGSSIGSIVTSGERT